MNLSVKRRANLLSNTNLILMVSLVLLAGVMLKINSPNLGLAIFYFTIIRVGLLLVTDSRWIIGPKFFILLMAIIIGQVIGYCLGL